MKTDNLIKRSTDEARKIGKKVVLPAERQERRKHCSGLTYNELYVKSNLTF